MAQSPSITTGSATSVTDLTAVLNGTMQPQGGVFNVTVQYGPTAAYGKSVQSPTVFTGTSATPFLIPVYDLLPSTTYHYRMEATNGTQVYVGDDLTFTTSVAATPPTISGLPGAQVFPAQPTTAEVYLSSGFTGSSSATLTVQYGTTTFYGTQHSLLNLAPNTYYTNGPSFSLSGLQPATLYHFRFILTNNEGSTISSDATFTTPSGPALAIAPATNVTDLSATLNGTLNTGDALLKVSFSWWSPASYQTLEISSGMQSNTAAPVSTTVTGLLPNTQYSYQFRTSDAATGNSIYFSTIGTFTTGPANTPPTILNLFASGIYRTQAVINANVAAGSSPATVVFEWGATTAYGFQENVVTPVPTSTTSPTGITVFGLTAGTTYHARAIATNAQGTVTSPDFTFTTAAPVPPVVGTTTVVQTRTTAAVVQAPLIFAGSSDTSVAWDVGLTTSYGTTVIGSPSTILAENASSVTAVFTGLAPSTTYHYRCRATCNEGTDTSLDGTFTTAPAPTPVTGAATNVSDLTAQLNGAVAAVGGALTPVFELGTTTAYGTPTPTFPSPITSPNSTATFGFASGLLPNTTYHYRLKVSDQDGNVWSGADQTFTTGAPATPPSFNNVTFTQIAAEGVTLQANVVAGSSAATFVFEYGTTTAYGSQVTHTPSLPIGQSDSITAPLSNLQPSTTYHYRIVGTNAQGTTTDSDQTFTTPALPTVTTDPASNVQALSAVLNGTYNKQSGSYTISFDYGGTTAYGLSASPQGNLIIGGGIIVVGGLGGGIIGGGGGGGPATTNATASVQPQTTYHFRLRLSDSYGHSYTGNDATFTTLAAIEAWRLANFGTTSNTGNAADDACPAGDGISNLMKYALGLPPGQRSSPPTTGIITVSNENYLSLTFNRNPGAVDLTYEVQAANDLAGPWDVVASVTPGTASASGLGLVSEIPFFAISPLGGPSSVLNYVDTVRDTVSTSSAPRRFLRLSVHR